MIAFSAFHRPAAMAAALLLLVACSSNKSADSTPCPQVATVRDLSHFPAMSGATLAPVQDQLWYTADLEQVSAACTTDDDKGLVIDADIQIGFHPESALPHGAELKGAHESLPYFISVIGPGQQILIKQIYTLDIDLAGIFGGDKLEPKHEPIEISIPQKTKVDQILIGFQLTPEQVDFNARTARGPAPFGGVMAPAAPSPASVPMPAGH